MREFTPLEDFIIEDLKKKRVLSKTRSKRMEAQE
jgi:hypothetical protein